MEAMQKMTKARAGLILDSPFFGSLALRLTLKQDDTCKTAWTDGITIGFNDTYINGLSLEESKGLLAHEVMHIACAHHCRRGQRDSERWNIATDYAINDILHNSGFKLPKGVLLGIYKDLNAEKIYSQLPNEPKENKKGNSRDNEFGEVRDLPGSSPGQPSTKAEKKQAEQNSKVAVNQAVRQAKSAGGLSDGLDRFIKDVLTPLVDWKHILRTFIQVNAKNDYSWSPPNRRYVHQGLYLPSLRSEEIDNIVIAVDTSGSVNVDVLNQFSSEISSILEEYDTTITVIYCDTMVQGVDTFNRQDLPLQMVPIGGGGTNFKPPFEYVDENGLNPACFIYLTDLQCHRFPEVPNYPVLWAHYGNYKNDMPFGDMIKID